MTMRSFFRRSHLGKPAVDRVERRRFMQAATALLAAPCIPAGVRFAMGEELFGEAHAFALADSPPTYFIEINLRDQWDFGHVFVPPGLATNTNLIRGAEGRKCSLYYGPEQITHAGNNIYLTPDSIALAPHVDSIAVLETNELCVGAIHGHEAVNAMRSPGRTKSSNGGMPLWHNEPGFGEQGNDYFYSTTPTPASLHNLVQKAVNPGIRNGIAMKFISRFHTVCHFAAGRTEGELTRIQSVQQLFDTFPDTVQDLNILPTAEEADLLERTMKRVDERFFRQYGYNETARAAHESNIGKARGLWHDAEPRIVSMHLTEEERAYWSAGVPDQVGATLKANIWEQAAWAFKLISNDITRSVSLEFDYLDVHDTRPDHVMFTMGLQAALPLARLIEKLKEAGIYEQTVIAIYSTDGGRAPHSASYGNEGKNTLVLAGRNVKGGYYGDVTVAGPAGDGHSYAYHVPDDSGVPQAGYVDTGNSAADSAQRLPGARSWRTVMRAAGVPDSLCDEFPSVAGVAPLNFMLRA